MKQLILIFLALITISLNATIVNKSSNIIKVEPNGIGHAFITIYENDSDTSKILADFSTYIGNKLEAAKKDAEWVEGKTLDQAVHELLEIIIIEESKNGGLFKYKPDLDAILIEELEIQEF